MLIEGGEEYKEVAPNNTFTVQKLQPYTNYTFYIRSYGTSASEQSQRVVCSTGETGEFHKLNLML